MFLVSCFLNYFAVARFIRPCVIVYIVSLSSFCYFTYVEQIDYEIVSVSASSACLSTRLHVLKTC